VSGDRLAQVTITATRHKNEKWRLHIVYPDGSYATHRGVVDYGYAGSIAERAIWRAEDMLARLDSGATEEDA
jgi:hypothetical protein